MKVNTDGILLGAWAPLPESSTARVLDIGCGTGLIALLLAERLPQAQLVAVEIDPAAAGQAEENAQASPFADRVEVVPDSIQNYAQQGRIPGKNAQPAFDLIVSNPPFFSGGVLSERENRMQARHTLKLSHTDLLGAVRDLLAPTGRFAVILPLIEGMRLIELATSYGLYLEQKLEVRPKADKAVHRLLLCFGKKTRANSEVQNPKLRTIQQSELVHYEDDNSWTADFRNLVGEFYRNPA